MAFYDFTGTNGDPLPAGLTTQSGAFQIFSNRLRATSAAAPERAVCTQPSNADDFVESTFNANGSSTTDTTGLVFRFSDDDNYWAVLVRGSDGLVRLFKKVSGSFTEVDSFSIVSFDANTDYIFKASFSGSAISVEVDAVEQMTATDSFNSTATLHGLRIGNTTHSMDSLTVPNAGAGDTLTIQTKDYTFKQRVAGSATITFDVDWSGTPTAIEYSVDGGGFVTGDATPVGNNSLIPVTITTGEHSIVFRFSNDTGVNDTAINVAASDNFAIFGQSNGSGRGTNNQVFSVNGNSDSAHLYGNDDTFKVLADPYDSNIGQVDLISSDANAAGSYTVRFANKFLAENNIPVGLLPTCKGGTEIAEFEKTSSVRIGGLNMYESMEGRITTVGGVTGVIYDQGEADAKDTNGTLASVYETALNGIVDDIFADFGVKTTIRALQTIQAAGYDGNGTTTGQNAIRQAQLNVATSNANAEITIATTDIDLSGGDGIHFQTDVDLDDIGVRVYNALSDLTSTSTLTITGIPDGTFLTTLITDDRPSTLIESVNRAYDGGEVTFIINVPAGTRVYGVVRDNLDPSTDGAAINAVTI